MYFADLIDELLQGQGPKVDPYLLILQDYISTWIEDIAAGLRDSPSRLYRIYRHRALAECIAGMAGEYEDHLLSIAARLLHIKPQELWVQLYSTAYKQARGQL